MILTAHLARGLRLAPLAALVLAGAGCPAPPPRAPACPSGSWCSTLEQAEPLGQTREHVLMCPMYVAWGAPGAPAPSPELPAAAEGKIDLEATRARRLTGAEDSCCYTWLVRCPEGKPLPSGSHAPRPRAADR